MAGLMNPGADAVKAGRQFVEDRRGDDRYAAEQEKTQIGLQDLNRQNEAADLDFRFDKFKREMGRGLQAFGMDPAAYQDAIDTVNAEYGRDAKVTHRKDASGAITFDLEMTNPEDGTPLRKPGMTKQELGSLLMMSMNPVGWFEAQEKTRRASAITESKRDFEMKKMGVEYGYKANLEKIKAGTKAQGMNFKIQKEMSDLSQSDWGKLGPDGTFTFTDDTFGADFAAIQAEYGASLAQFGGGRFKGDTTASNSRALSKVKQLKKMFENDAKLMENLDDDQKAEWVKDKVAETMMSLSADVRETYEGGAQPDVIKTVESYISKAREEGKPEAEIKQALESRGYGKYYQPTEAQPDTGLAAPAETKAGPAETDKGLDDQAAAAPDDKVVAMESAVQKGDDLGLVEGAPVEFGSDRVPVPGKKTRKRGPPSGEQAKRKDKSLDESIAKHRGYGTKYGGKESMQLPRLRDKAAARVKKSLAGGGKITSRKILTAALKSGKLTPEETKKVKEALTQSTTAIAAN